MQVEKQEEMQRVEATQELNEAIANIPSEFAVNGCVIKVRSLPINRMVIVDKKILELHKLAVSEDVGLEDEETFWDVRISKVSEYYSKISEVIFSIINPNPDEPEFSIEWIEENVHTGPEVTDEEGSGLAVKIIDAYNAKCSPQELVKKILLSRKF